METTLLTTKVKAKFCFLILCLWCQQYFLETSASINKSDVAKYLIHRKADRAGDEFSVLFKQGCNQDRCNPTNMVNFCANLSAYSTTSPENFRHSCSCKESDKTWTFLPEEGKCVTDETATNSLPGAQALPAIGCSRYMLSWSGLFLNGFDLRNNGTGHYPFQNSSFQSCEVMPGSPMYYDNLGSRWKRILPEIFTVRFVRYNGIILKWEADTNNTLSGRILSLFITCNYTASPNNFVPLNGCLLFKAVGDVTYNYVSQNVAPKSGYPSGTISSSAPVQSILHVSTSVASSLLSSPSLMLQVSSSSSPVTTTVQVSLKTPATSLASSFFPRQSQNSQTSDLSKITVSTTVLPSKPETWSTISFSSMEGLSDVVVSTITLKPAIKTNVFSVHPSKPSLTTKAASSSAAINRPGNKKARVNGSDNGVVIGAAVGGAAVCGIFIVIIIVFCKRRKPWSNQEKTTRLQVKNPVYGSSDIPLSSATENQVRTLMDQDSQPTYQDLTTDNGKLSGAVIYNNPDDDDYDNYNAYQSLDKKVPGSPVYQSLTKGSLDTGKPTPKSKPSITGPPGERCDDTAAEPVYNVIEQPVTDQGSMPEKASGDSDEHMQEPVYNVLDGSDSEENYDAGDSLYNVLEEPETIEDQQQPLYNVLESSHAEKSSLQVAQGLSNEPLYNVVEGPDSDGPSKDGVGYDGPNGSSSSDGRDNPAYEESLNFGPSGSDVGCAAPNGSSSPDAHDNPAYEQSLDFDVPYASVQRPSSQRESVYEPLQGPNDHSLYEPLK